MTVPGTGKPACKNIGLSINLDSMRECLKLAGAGEAPAGFRDSAFFEIMDRFLSLAGRWQAPLTIFVIGRDLEDPANRARVAEWSALGHEIGNHTYSHFQNLGNLPPARIRDEIRRTHDLIGA